MAHGRPDSILIRADASRSLGVGHLSRCMVLADTLASAGARITFAGADGFQSFLPPTTGSDHQILPLDRSNAFEPAALALKNFDFMIIDHYQSTAEYESRCRDQCGRLLVIDDLADRAHDCDYLLNQSPGAGREDYDGLVAATTRLMLGGSAALLRPQFGLRRRNGPHRAPKNDVERILVMMGGTDAKGLTETVVRAAAGVAPAVEVDVLVGANAAETEGLEALARRSDATVRVRRNVSDVASLMAGCDLAVVAAGVGCLEICSLGRPTLALVVADNQRPNGESLRRLDAARVLDARDGLAERELADALRELLGDGDVRARLAANALAVSDGLGARRVADAICHDRRSKAGQPVRLHPPNKSDGDMILAWQGSPRVREFSRNPAVPTAAEHAAWFGRKLGDPGCVFHMIEHGGAPAGFVRLDRTEDPQPDVFEVSIVVAPDHQGCGVGRLALVTLQSLLPEACMHAFVMAENVGSHRLFRSAGYQPSGDGYVRMPRPEGPVAGTWRGHPAP